MKDFCTHQWGEETETCRTCEGTDIGLVEMSSEPSTPSFFKVKTEPLYGEYCLTCDEFTMVSLARHCELCGAVDFLSTMDEEIFSQ